MTHPSVPASIRGSLMARVLAMGAVLLASAGAAYAQAAAPAPAAGDPMGLESLQVNFAPILLLVVIFWLLIFRPQQKRMKAQQAMLSAIRRGDTVVTSGGIIGKVTKAVDGEDLEVEIGQVGNSRDGVRVKVARGMITDVRSKAEPVNDNAKA
jgi:preprotein translocase subunit YajC